MFQKGHQINNGRIPWNKGRKTPKKIRKKISKSHKGKRHTEETRKKMKLRKGENHPMWKGGISATYRVRNAPRPKPEQCEICGAFSSDFKKGLCYDHCHKTGKFRGWICMRCNMAIGLVKENKETLLSMIKYIEKDIL